MDCSKKDLIYYGNKATDKKRLFDIEEKLFERLKNFHGVKEKEIKECKITSMSHEIFRNLLAKEEYDYFKHLKVTINFNKLF